MRRSVRADVGMLVIVAIVVALAVWFLAWRIAVLNKLDDVWKNPVIIAYTDDGVIIQAKNGALALEKR